MLKKKTLLLTIALFAASAGLWAQQNDSLTFAKAKWDTKKVAKGIVWKQYHFKDAEKIFGAEEFVNVIEIDQKKAKKRFAFYHKPENLSRTSNAAIEKDAVVAIYGPGCPHRRKRAPVALRCRRHGRQMGGKTGCPFYDEFRPYAGRRLQAHRTVQIIVQYPASSAYGHSYGRQQSLPDNGRRPFQRQFAGGKP